jgi:hypothetical protein
VGKLRQVLRLVIIASTSKVEEGKKKKKTHGS